MINEVIRSRWVMSMIEELYPHVTVERDDPVAHLVHLMEKGSLITVQDQSYNGAKIDACLAGRHCGRCRRDRPGEPRQEIRQFLFAFKRFHGTVKRTATPRDSGLVLNIVHRK